MATMKPNFSYVIANTYSSNVAGITISEVNIIYTNPDANTTPDENGNVANASTIFATLNLGYRADSGNLENLIYTSAPQFYV
jgi:hypothetical protein